MQEETFTNANQMSNKFKTLRLCICLMVCASLFLSSCMMPNPPEVYYGQVVVPKEQEFRWSDGGLPKIFDPTFAAVPPDTDAVRAIYEGLTDYDPNSAEPLPAVAWKWESSSDKREWTFHLRRNAHWSNGDLVTAHDFVLSWQRVLNNRETSPHAKLLSNIVGAFDKEKQKEPSVTEPFPTPETIYTPPQTNVENTNVTQNKLGVEAINDFELKIKLIHPNPDFPSLVTHPVFRPIHKSLIETNTPISSEKVVTNGAFELKKNGTDAVVIERAKNYWDAETVNLQRVLFMPAQDVEGALAAYKAGKVDAVTNTRFEPLGLKLLEPYKDFRKETYGALTYYHFNTSRKPFDDLRVREALAIAIDRERINEDTLDGASKPANSFLPVQESDPSSIEKKGPNKLFQNTERAKELLSEAGFPLGAGFPKIKLLVNRNDQQKQVANTVAEMWKRVLNIETEVIIRSWDEYELALKNGEYDIARRGLVMQTINETSNMLAMFEPLTPVTTEQESNSEQTQPTPNAISQPVTQQQNPNAQTINRTSAPLILTEEQALKELPAIPIYFSSSYSLVKPYIVGFDSNVLDAPLLKQVKIKTDWKAEPKTSPSTQNLIQ